jgi:hypothetical protein
MSPSDSGRRTTKTEGQPMPVRDHELPRSAYRRHFGRVLGCGRFLLARAHCRRIHGAVLFLDGRFLIRSGKFGRGQDARFIFRERQRTAGIRQRRRLLSRSSETQCRSHVAEGAAPGAFDRLPGRASPPRQSNISRGTNMECWWACPEAKCPLLGSVRLWADENRSTTAC